MHTLFIYRYMHLFLYYTNSSNSSAYFSISFQIRGDAGALIDLQCYFLITFFPFQSYKEAKCCSIYIFVHHCDCRLFLHVEGINHTICFCVYYQH